MFEGIPFVDFSLSNYPLNQPISAKAIKDSGLFPSSSLSDLEVMNSHVENTQFQLSGLLRVMPPLPITTAARSGLLYLESFSIAISDAGHYTKRSGSCTYLLLYTYAGKGTLEYEGNKYYLQEGDGFLIDCRKPHVFRSDGPHWERADLYFNGYTADAFFAAFSHNGDVMFHSKSGFQTRLENLLKNYHRIHADRDLMIHSCLTELLSWLLTKRNNHAPSETEESIARLIRYLGAHFPEPITMDDLAGIANISKYHLSREFRRLTGYAPIEYLVMIRIENAGMLLRNTRLSISQIAENCGINSEQYLCRQFQKHFGTSPGRYRRLHNVSLTKDTPH